MSEILFCNKCGLANAPGAQFCSGCGAAMNPALVPGTAPAAGAFPAAGTAYSAASTAYPPVSATTRYGGFWIRFVAIIIDGVLVRVVVHPIAAIFGLGGLGLSGLGFGGLRHGMSLPLLLFGGGVLALLIIGANWLYEALMLSSSYQATLGKMIFGMKVTDLQGNPISFARATGRHFAKWISGIILCIGYIMAGFTERKQALHDMLAGTLVRRS